MAFFADFLAGAAESASGEIGRRQAEQSKIEAEQRQQDLAIERERVVAQMKADMAEQAATAKSQRTAEQMTAVNAAAPAVTAERQLGEAQSRAPNLTADTLSTVKQNLSPSDIQKYYGVQDNVLTRIGDKQTAARQGGFFDAEALLEKAHKDTVDALKLANDERKIENADRKTDVTAATALAGQEAADRRAEASNARALQIAGMRQNGGGKGKTTNGESVERLTTQWNTVIKAKKDLVDQYGSKAAAMPLFRQYEADEADISSALRERRKRPADAEDSAGGTAAPAPAGKTSALPTISSKADYDRLPSGSTFISPDGKKRVKP